MSVCNNPNASVLNNRHCSIAMMVQYPVVPHQDFMKMQEGIYVFMLQANIYVRLIKCNCISNEWSASFVHFVHCN